MMTHRSLLAAVAGCTILVLAGLAPSQDRPDPYAGHVATTPPRTPEEERKALRVPPGFEVQLVASEPDIRKPLNIAFDARGRLWVTDTFEYPFPAPEGKGRDSVKVLEEIGSDGRARKITTFATGLNIPIGVLPLPGGRGDEALVHSIPHVLRLRDTDGDGKADRREVAYATYGFADTHGMTSGFTPGFDGWIYACHGFANTSTIQGSDGQAITMNSGNIYRMRPDGSHLEQHTWGQVNPFGLSLDPLGNLYSADCHSQPIYQLLRGAYYPSFGKPHDGLGFGPEMISGFKGSTAICGIAFYAADHFPAPYQGSAFVGDVVATRIFQFRLDWKGTSPRATTLDFVTSADPWFRPVDIKLGPDGALYVADFYNRIIGHYEVPLTHPGRDRERGRIWRIVYRGPDGKGKLPEPPRDRTKTTVAELVRDLGSPNLTVRLQAAEQLVARGGHEAAEAIRGLMHRSSNPWQRVHGMWVLERRNGLDDWTLAALVQDVEAAVRVHALRVLAERQSLPADQRDLVIAALRDGDPFVQRAAAETLGRHPAVANLRPLLDLRHTVPAADTHLLHVVRLALRDNLKPAAVWGQLPLPRWTERDARAVADVALGVPTPEAAAYLLAHLKEHPEAGEKLLAALRHVARYGANGIEQPLVAFARAHRPDDLPVQAALCKSLYQGVQERGSSLTEEARRWANDLTSRLLTSPQDRDVMSGIDLAGTLRMESQQGLLAKLTANVRAPESQRAAALAALANIDGRAHAAAIGRILMDPAQPYPLREHAAVTLARVNQPEALAQVVQALPAAPARLQNVIAAVLVTTRPGAERLLEAIEQGKASARLLQERAVEIPLSRANNKDLAARIAKLTQGLPRADQRVQELFERRRAAFATFRPDPVKGAALFEKHCGICHQVGGKGAKIGPQLDGIGARGLDRLLEDILDPNRNVDQTFRLSTLDLKNGQVVSGLLLREEGEVLVLADNQGKEVRVAKNSVEEKQVSPLSPMPANFAEQVPEADFHHLMAYLLALRPPG
jgi:putative heme-binding domain-containing protein